MGVISSRACIETQKVQMNAHQSWPGVGKTLLHALSDG
jgi:hypothetical protein